MDKTKSMKTTEITDFLNQYPKDEHFRIVCELSISLSDVVIEKRVYRGKSSQLVKVVLGLGFKLQRDLRTSEKVWLLKANDGVVNPRLEDGVKVLYVG